MSRALILSIALLLAACGGKEPVIVKLPASFNPRQARQMLEPGDNEVTGSVYLKLSSGGLISCAGEPVSLYPATEYARQWAENRFGDPELSVAVGSSFAYRPHAMEKADIVDEPSFLDTRRVTQCDLDGNFKFEAIGNGEFFILARVSWQKHLWDQYKFMYGQTHHDKEGLVLKKIRLHGGEKLYADLRWSMTIDRYSAW